MFQRIRLQCCLSTLIYISLLSFLSVSPLFGQAISGDLTGTVTDATGAAVGNVKVVAENEGTGVKTTVTANAEGVYRLNNLPVGAYSVSASASGFSTATLKGVRIVLSNVATANIALEIGSAATTVEVTDAGAAIDTTTAQLQTSYETKQITDLPTSSFSKTTNGAGIWNLSLIGAGVSSQGGVGQGTGPAIAGQRPENNTFNIDGVSNNNHYNTGPLVYISNESVAQISLLQNQFSPEFGGASGGVFNAVVKSGGNEIHGSVYEYFQNRNLNAVDATSAVAGLRSNPRYDNNRLGATIGGPIFKQKLFYFGNFEYNPVGKSGVPGAPLSAPTAAGFSTLSGIPGLSKNNLGILQKYVPAASTNDAGSVKVSGINIPVGDVSFVTPVSINNYNAIVSLDYNMSDKDQWRGRWVYNKSEGTQASPPQLPVFAVAAPNNNYLYSLSEFHNFSPTLQNEFRASFSRNVNSTGVPDLSYPGLDAFPNITLQDLNSLNIGPTGPDGSIQNLFQLQDNISKVWGKHTLKTGYHFTDVILTNYFIQRVRGDYQYSTLDRYLNDIVPDLYGERSAGPTSYPAGFLQNEAFFNDDYRILPNLTLNLGVRYEYVTMPIASRYQVYSAPANIPGPNGLLFNRPYFSKNDWSPRVGFAYSPGKNGLWSIRGGFARAFNLTYANLTSNAAPPFFQQTNDVNLNSNAGNFLGSGGLSGALVPLPTNPRDALGVVGSYTFGNQRPYGLTWNFGVQRVLKGSYTFEARYVGTKGVHLWNQERLNVVAPVSSTNYIPTFINMPSAATFASLTKTLGQVQSVIVPGGTADQPYNIYASRGSNALITGYAPQGNSIYHGLALQITKRYSNNFSFIAAYTWSHLLDDSTATNFSTYLTPRRAQEYHDLRSEWASSALDRRHRFTFTPVYDWRPFQGHAWLLKNLVGNWNISGTYTYESPEYATVQSGVDSNLNSDAAGDRSVINPAGPANVGSGVRGYNGAGVAVEDDDPSIVAYVATNPNARYVVAGAGALANGGRNSFPLQNTNNIDLAIRKRLDFGERIHFDIGAQAFNVLNHAQFTGGYLSDVSSNGYTAARNALIPGDPLFGRFDQFYSSNSRSMQLVAHISF